MNTLYIILAIIAVLSIIGLIITHFCMKDDKPDIKCPHANQTKVVVSSTATCETIHTICDDCSKVLKVKVEC